MLLLLERNRVWRLLWKKLVSRHSLSGLITTRHRTNIQSQRYVNNRLRDEIIGNLTAHAILELMKTRFVYPPKSNHNSKLSQPAFTIIELLVVIVIIGVLAAIVYVSYVGIQTKARDASVLSDLDTLDGLETNYGLKNNLVGKAWYSGSGIDSDLSFTPSGGNVIDVVIDSSDYCIRGYHPQGTKNTIYNASTKESSSGACDRISPSYEAQGIITITAIAAITGTTSIGSVLTAGSLTPSGANATYQWRSSTTAGGTYTNISGATSSTYTLVAGDNGKYIKVVATGTGNYTGTQTSAASAVVTDPNWLTIGTQTWAKANLNVGTMVTGVTTQTNNSTVEKYCSDDNSANCTTYGGLYQWNEAMQYVTTEGVQGICPTGSHIPSDNDWKILEMQLGMSQEQADATGWRGTDQGTQLKSGGTSGLNMPLAGARLTDGSFFLLSGGAGLWSSSESSTSAWYRSLYSGYPAVNRDTEPKGLGYSVRCLEN